MCGLCEGTGGLNIYYSWGVQIHPCPNSDCDFDREKEERETDAVISRMKAEIEARNYAVS